MSIDLSKVALVMLPLVNQLISMQWKVTDINTYENESVTIRLNMLTADKLEVILHECINNKFLEYFKEYNGEMRAVLSQKLIDVIKTSF